MTIERFDVVDQPSEVLAALDRDGAVIIEGLLADDVVARVNEEVEAAVAAADPDGPMFNPMAKAFMGAFTKNVPGVPGISRTFATEVMCHPVLLALADAVLGPSLRPLPAQPRTDPPTRSRLGGSVAPSG